MPRPAAGVLGGSTHMVRRGSLASMASILPFIKRETVFDDATTRVMGDAFDAVCKSLRDKGQPEIVYEVIARRIIDAAKKGERDPERLRAAGNVGLRAR
jgi:hypothetical protein